MKLGMIVLCMMFAPSITWLGDFDAARQEAVKSHKFILVNFSGSDWCGPCIRLRKEILESPLFEGYAEKKLVLVRADFPRQKKDRLPEEQVKRNEALADLYNPDGKFPYTLLIDVNGKVIKTWDGFPNETVQQFIDDIDVKTNASR